MTGKVFTCSLRRRERSELYLAAQSVILDLERDMERRDANGEKTSRTKRKIERLKRALESLRTAIKEPTP